MARTHHFSLPLVPTLTATGIPAQAEHQSGAGERKRRVAAARDVKSSRELCGEAGDRAVTSALGAGYTADGIAVGAGAVRDAVGHALRGLRRPASFVLVFPPATMAPEEVVAQAGDAAAGVPWAGMSSDGVVAAGAMIPDGCAALAFDDTVEAGVGLALGASHDPRGAAARASADAFTALDPEAGQPLLLLLYDADSGPHGDLVSGAYEIVGPRVPIAGGGANAPVGARPRIAPQQYAAGGAHRDAVVAVGLVTRAAIGIGVGTGCELETLPAIVTRSDGRRILGLNGRSAEDEYLDAIGSGRRELSDADFERLAVLHPLAQLELGGRIRPRHVRGRAPAGGLLCAAAIPENAAVAFGEQSPRGIVASARTAMRDAIAPLEERASAALVFDCAARRRVLGIDPQAEVDALTSTLGTGRPLVGLYTRGEVARMRGATGDLNHAVVIVAFA
jgi:hypothetical protein